MKKWIISAIVGFVVIGVGVGVYVWRNLEADSRVEVVDQSGLDEELIGEMIDKSSQSESNDQQGSQAMGAIEVRTVSQGEFVRYDPVHYANGKAVVYETAEGPVLKLEDFETSDGPDLFVYLVTESEVSGIKAERGESVSLGKLKSITGEQVYKLPENYIDYGAVVIWCRAFDINFSSASLSEV